MSDSDAYEYEMRMFSSIDDRDQDRVLAGRTEAVRDDLRELAAFCHEAKALYVTAPSEPVAARHLAEITAAAGIVADRKGATPSRPVGEPLPAVAVISRWRAPFASLGTRLALAGAGAALLAAFAGGAVAGVLPGALQDKVVGIARNVGLSLPDGRTHPHPIGISSRPKAAPAKPSAGHVGAGAADTENTKSGGEQTTQAETDKTTRGETDKTTQGETDKTTQGETDKTTPGETDKTTPGASDQRTQTDTQRGAPDGTDGSRQPNASGANPPTSGGGTPESDGIPSDGSSPTVGGDAPTRSDSAAQGIPTPTASPDDNGG